MRMVVTGSKGQLGGALHRQAEAEGHTVLGMDLPEHDFTNLEALHATLQEFAPEVVMHCGAYTDVDGAELNPDLAYRVNALGPRNFALWCEQAGVPLMHFSTDWVFNAPPERSTPFREWEALNPLCSYAKSKAVGEWYVQSLTHRYYIVRGSWLYGAGGNNFIAKIVRAADERGSLSVVTDEISTPTWVEDVAAGLLKLVSLPAPIYGVYHLPNNGYCSRYEYAAEVMRLTGRADVPLKPTILANYPRAAQPPQFSALGNFVAAELGIKMRPWQEALAAYIANLPAETFKPGMRHEV
jgi:dTDP-4-dehydrorhamnose reductase